MMLTGAAAVLLLHRETAALFLHRESSRRGVSASTLQRLNADLGAASTGSLISRVQTSVSKAKQVEPDVDEEDGLFDWGSLGTREADRDASRSWNAAGQAVKAMEDGLFDWSSLGTHEARFEPAGSLRRDASRSWDAAGQAVEESLEGLVTLASNVAGSVAGALANATAAALGERSDMAGAVLALHGSDLASHSGAPPSVSYPSNLQISMPLKPVQPGMIDQWKEPLMDEPGSTGGNLGSPNCRASSRHRTSSRGPKRFPQAPTAPPVPTPDGSCRIAVLCNGSEGDLRPLLALAKVLTEDHGHTVHVFTNANMVHLCFKHGLDAVPVFADSQAVIQKLGGMRGNFMEAVTKPTKIAEKWLKEHDGEYVPVLDALDNFDPHGMIAGAQVTGPCLRYEFNRGVPAMPVFLSRPWLEESAFNLLVDKEPPRPSFYAISEVVDRKPVARPRMLRTGAWVLNDTPSLEDLSPGGPLCELKEFLDKGPPPVAVGWGSMLATGLPPAEMLELALRALMQAGRRGVVLGGWAELDRVAAVAAAGRLPSRLSDGGKLATFAKEQVCFVPSAPHEWLFPQCCCIIHHGGVGTLHAALRAYRPSVVTPICADQFTSAEVVTNHHAGVGFTKGLPDISAKELSHAIGAALSTPTVVAAQTTGRRVQREESQGVSRAAELIDGFLRGKIKLGKGGRWVKRVVAKKDAVAPMASE